MEQSLVEESLFYTIGTVSDEKRSLSSCSKMLTTRFDRTCIITSHTSIPTRTSGSSVSSDTLAPPCALTRLTHSSSMIGHSLGGALAGLLGVTFGVPVVAFEAPGEKMAARRLHLPSPVCLS